MAAEIATMGPQAKEGKNCQQPPEAKRETWDGSSPGPPEGTNPAETLISDFLASKTMTEWIDFVLNHQVHGY